VGLLGRLKEGLTKTRGLLAEGTRGLLRPGKAIEEGLWEELEELLIEADVGVAATQRLLEVLKEEARRRDLKGAEDLYPLLKGEILRTLKPCEAPFRLQKERPTVVFVVGVNGVGKTTTIAKIAHRYTSQGRRVMVAAADTFRPAAIDQLQIWSQRAGAQMVRHREGADPSAVAYDALQAASARGYDLLLIDTAGRLHTKGDLMEELRKTKRVLKKLKEEAPHEILLVLDATNGQNALVQAKTFHQALEVTGIALVKLDGTAKGGILVAIAEELGIPLRFLGVGEGLEDLEDFEAEAFVEALFSEGGATSKASA